jgi:osmotically-inducible protein OsmY
MGTTMKRRVRLLFGASIAIAILGAGCGSSEYARRRDSDQRLSAIVAHRLAAEPALASAGVQARSHRGVVALVGEVGDEASKREAERIASAVPGVARVDNLILVVEGDSRAAGSAPAKGALILARTE